MRGTYPSQAIRRLIQARQVESELQIEAGQVQPASLDLSLAEEAYAVPGSMLPLPGEEVRQLVRRFSRRQLDLSRPTVFDRGGVYVVRLNERLSLPPAVAGYANSKSSIGRVDVQTRVLTAGNPRYDRVPAGYTGELWLEVIPKSFDVCVRAGDSLSQMIFYEGRVQLSPAELDALAEAQPLLYTPDARPIAPGAARFDDSPALFMSLDLDQEVVGYVAKRSFRPVDLADIGGHAAADFFSPIPRPAEKTLYLSQGEFYIFSTHEYISIPPEFAVEMLPFDTSAGEFRAHYAGFFDPGFGFGDGSLKGTPAVLEVRPYEDDLIVRDRQPVCKMAYERLTEPPELVYGLGLSSNYAQQRGPRLSKYFR